LINDDCWYEVIYLFFENAKESFINKK
jgi:hypothetical protein